MTVVQRFSNELKDRIEEQELDTATVLRTVKADKLYELKQREAELVKELTFVRVEINRVEKV